MSDWKIAHYNKVNVLNNDNGKRITDKSLCETEELNPEFVEYKTEEEKELVKSIIVIFSQK